MPSQVVLTTAEIIARHGLVGNVCRFLRGDITIEGIVSGHVHFSRENKCVGTPLGHTITLTKLTWTGGARDGASEWMGGCTFVVPPDTYWERVRDQYMIFLGGSKVSLVVQREKLRAVA